MKEAGESKQSLKSQSAWLLFAKITGFCFAFLLPLIIVRFLSQDKVGVYRQMFLVVTNAVSILPLGFSMSAFYFLSRDAANRSAAVLNILLFNFVMGGLACLGLFLFPQWLGNLFQNDQITRLAPLIGVVIWLWIFSAFLETAAVANRESKMATVFIIAAQLSKTVLMAGAVLFFATIDAFLYAAIIQAALQTIILLVYLNSRFPRFWRSFSFAFFREHLLYALPFGFAGLLWVMQTDVHNYFVGHRFSPADYAIYAYGCFQLPLIAMLSESITSVLIPRMSELQSRDDRREIIRITARAMQKLAFFFFPLYVFLFITAQTFIVTLFTRNYAASVSIFLINLTLLPFDIWIIDPIIRAYKELGRRLLVVRVCIFVALLTALYFGIQYFDLRGMISIVVAIVLVIKRLNVAARDALLLKGVGLTGIAAIGAGAVTFAVYSFVRDAMPSAVQSIYVSSKQNVNDSVSGALVLAVCGAVFLPVYLLVVNYLGLIEKDEKKGARDFYGKIFGYFSRVPAARPRL
jgi:O-antigen/teichoic acid export membrane protein